MAQIVGMAMIIRRLEDSEAAQVLSLVREVFPQYKAPEYSAQGVAEFERSISGQQWLRMLRLYRAFDGASLVGSIATRSQGSNSSPYAVPVYRRLGFLETAAE